MAEIFARSYVDSQTRLIAEDVNMHCGATLETWLKQATRHLSAVMICAVWPDVLKQSWLLVALAWPIIWVEWTHSSVRRKLAVAQWPGPLYL